MLPLVLTPCLGNSLTALKTVRSVFFFYIPLLNFSQVVLRTIKFFPGCVKAIKNRRQRDQGLCTLPIKLCFKGVRSARRWHDASKCTKKCTQIGLKLQRKMMFPAPALPQHPLPLLGWGSRLTTS